MALGPAHMREIFFDLGEAGNLEGSELDLLERLGCRFVDCEACRLPRAVRRLRRPLSYMVDVIQTGLQVGFRHVMSPRLHRFPSANGC